MPARSTTKPLLRPKGYEQVTSWNGLERGDDCKVTRTRGTWAFHSHVTSNGETWVTVYGPKGSDLRQYRSFDPDRVRPTTRRKAS